MNKDESIRFASRYLEDLLSFFGINVAVTSTIDDEVIQLSAFDLVELSTNWA